MRYYVLMSSRSTFVLLQALLVCAPSIFGQNGSTKVEQDILRLEEQWFKAYLNSDAETMNRIEAEDMVVITHLISSTDDMKPIQKKRDFSRRSEATKAALTHRSRSLSNVHVRVLGDAAVLNAIQTDTGVPGAEPIKTAYTSVWAKRGGVWQIVNAQWTAIQEKK